jgi:hypothetical protein
MFASLTVVSFIFAFAGLQQIFLNRLMESDLETLKNRSTNAFPKSPDSTIQPSDSHAS